MYFLRAFCLMSLMWLAPISGAPPSLASSSSDRPADSILFVSLPDSEALRTLLESGVCVSRQLPGGAILFGDAQTKSLVANHGYEVQLLETNIEDREHYIVWADRHATTSTVQRKQLLYTDETYAIVSIPAGEVESLVGIGGGIERLFRSPLRLPSEARSSLTTLPRVQVFEEFVSGLVSQVSEDSLVNNVLELESFGTRHANTPPGRAVPVWLESKFRSYGIGDVEIHKWDDRLPGNVIATIPGTDPTAGIYILGGHYDSIVPTGGAAPGADDNATGTATVLECARVLARHQFRATIRLIGFSAEEIGLVGSAKYAYRAVVRGEFIVGMINVDMLGYRAPKDTRDLDLIVEPPSDWLRVEAVAAQRLYVPELPVVKGKLRSGTSDHASFLRQGFDAIFLHEDSGNSSPYIHTVNDIFGTSYNDSELHAGATRIALAMLAAFAEPVIVPVTFQSFAVAHTQEGVELGWELSGQGVRETAGIHVERATERTGPFHRRTQHLLPSGVRRFVDADVEPDAAYWYRLVLENLQGEFSWSPAVLVHVGANVVQTGLEPPFWSGPGGDLQIRYRIGPAAAQTTLGIYDVRGRQVRALTNGLHTPGEYLRSWDRRDSLGRPVTSGIYIVRLASSRVSVSRKVSVLSH